MRLSKRKAYYFAEWLYDGSTIKLERKYKNYLRFVKPQDYNRNYRNIRLLKSGRYFVHVQLNNKKISLGTFDTVKEAVDSYNKFASENGLKLQKYIGEELFGDNINE